MISFLYSKGSVVLHDSKFGSVSEGFTLINEKANFSWKALGDELWPSPTLHFCIDQERTCLTFIG